MNQILQILLVDDEPVIQKTLGNYLTRSGYHVTNCYTGADAIQEVQKSTFDLVFLDLVLPDQNGLHIFENLQQMQENLPVIIITGNGNMDVAIQALRLGAADFLTKPISLLELDAVIEKATRLSNLNNQTRGLRQTIKGIQNSENIRKKNRTFIGISPAAAHVRNQIQQATEAQVNTILITGETGTGKEVVARSIHFLSHTEQAPFIAINCPSLTETLIEDELFGHEKGTFTNAISTRPGYFEMANDGTLFLDEIGDLNHTLQASLLRVLDTRHIRRIGGLSEIPINCTVIAATNVDLEQQLKTHHFRNDLFYRLNLFHIHLPPLREHPEDIIPLAQHFLSLSTQTRNLILEGFSPEAERRLQNYHYPGNVRELRNIIEQATIFCKSGRIDIHHLNIGLPSATSATIPSSPPDNPFDHQTLIKTLETTHWNRRETARKLGITYAKLRYWMQKLNIN